MNIIFVIFLACIICIIVSSMIMTTIFSEDTYWNKKVSWVEAIKNFSIIYFIGFVFLISLFLIKKFFL